MRDSTEEDERYLRLAGKVLAGKGILIETNDRHRRLFLSNRLSNYRQLRSHLQSWASPSTLVEWRAPSLWAKIWSVCQVLGWMSFFAGPLYLIYTPHRAVILPLGIALSLGMLGMILYVRGSPAMPIRARKYGWFLLLLPIGAMLFRLYLE